MAISNDKMILRSVTRLFESGTLTGLSESELLDRFVIRHDDVAFEALVVRHGPMVLGVCRRYLSNPHDVDDAFQATFLVLVKRAESIRDRSRLASWLFGVARHVSLKARERVLRRQRTEGAQAIDQAEKLKPEHPLKSLLDEELARLSERDRAAIVLCDLEGLTGDEAAEVLGLRAVTLRSRLHRARMRLKDRLVLRGVTNSAGLTTAALSANVSRALAEQTVQAAIAACSKNLAAGAISATVLSLTQGVLHSMMLTKLKYAAAMFVAVGLVGTTATVTTAQIPANPTPSSNENDRLKRLEEKLDKFIEVLDKRLAPPQAMIFPPVAPRAVNPVIQPALPATPVLPSTPEIRALESASRRPVLATPEMPDTPLLQASSATAGPSLTTTQPPVADPLAPASADLNPNQNNPFRAPAQPGQPRRPSNRSAAASSPRPQPTQNSSNLAPNAGERISSIERRMNDIQMRFDSLEKRLKRLEGNKENEPQPLTRTTQSSRNLPPPTQPRSDVAPSLIPHVRGAEDLLDPNLPAKASSR
jgi:RNA polymerase sigma factor (sigma-70 family)